ncbi:MAG: GIY-YIG nuclease family protein [Candidatus Wildermuthbacteria bacterium]|nr:GIY-YIG nuclease family protein [Candidatus Wildermuthbacteria bacterium]
MAWVYILQSTRDDRFYIGSTSNLTQRLRHHLGGFTPTTKKFGKVKLVFSQEYPNLKEARYIEKKLKHLKRKDYIEKIVRDGKIRMGA